MLTNDPKELDTKSEVITQLLAKRADIKIQLDAMSADVEKSTSLSSAAATQLAALHREYERLKSEYNKNSDAANQDIDERLKDNKDEQHGRAMVGGYVGLLAAGMLTILTGGGGFPALIVAAGGVAAGAGAGGASTAEEEEKIKKERDSKLKSVEEKYEPKISQTSDKISAKETAKKNILKQLKTAEQKKLYFGVIAELLLDNGINITRQLQQYAEFNGTSVDAVFGIRNKEIRDILERMATGYPKAEDIDHLIAAVEQRKDMQGTPKPEIRALKQFINHVLVPNKLYFDILASFADDIRAQDMSQFPPLEILGTKPISLSGRLLEDDNIKEKVGTRYRVVDGVVSEIPLKKSNSISPEKSAKEADKLLEQAKAKVEVRDRIASGAVYEILKDEGVPQLKRMENLVEANDAEMAKYADVFSEIEKALMALTASQEILLEQTQGQRSAIGKGGDTNKMLDSRIREIQARNNAKQKAATRGSLVRGGTAVAAGIGLAMFDGGATAVLTAKGMAAKAGIAKMLVGKGLKDSAHSITYGVGQGAATSLENDLLDDYMHSLQLQKVDISALQKELDGLEKAIKETAKSKEFQALLKDAAKKSQIAETLLLRSLIRNGYNNSLEIEEVCQQAGVASIDAFLEHYKGTRLGLALKKHCHGLADSNDISVILAEANCLRGTPDGFDRALKEYVEETMKPNIGSYYSKASKMDVISRNNLTGFGNDLHFSAEMQMETNRAVKILTANEYGMSVIGREDVRGLFDFWLHRHGDERLYDDKIRDGEMSDEYPDKRVSHLPADQMKRFVDMAKRSVASGRKSFPKVGDMFMRVCAHEYFLPQAVHVGGKDNIFTDYPESPSAYPMVNTVVGEFIRKMSFAHLDDYRGKVGERLDNVIAASFIEFFNQVGEIHHQDVKLLDVRNRVKDAANYDDYAPVFDRYAKRITGDALQRFDLFLDIYKQALEKQYEVATEEDRRTLDEQIEKVKGLADGKLNPDIVRPGTQAARLRAYDESHLGENLSGRV